jgi:hypothetical protein
MSNAAEAAAAAEVPAVMDRGRSNALLLLLLLLLLLWWWLLLPGDKVKWVRWSSADADADADAEAEAEDPEAEAMVMGNAVDAEPETTDGAKPWTCAPPPPPPPWLLLVLVLVVCPACPCDDKLVAVALAAGNERLGNGDMTKCEEEEAAAEAEEAADDTTAPKPCDGPMGAVLLTYELV